MGVDYCFDVVKKKKSGEIEKVSDDSLPDVFFPNVHPIFSWPFDIEKLERLAGQKLNLDFYDVPNHEEEGKETNTVFDPKSVKKTLLLLLRIIKHHPNEFPHYYYWGGMITIKGERFYAKGDWDELKLVRRNGELVADLLKERDKWINVKGEKDKYLKAHGIKELLDRKSTPYEYYKERVTDDIITLCDYAIKHKYYVKTRFV